MGVIAEQLDAGGIPASTFSNTPGLPGSTGNASSSGILPVSQWGGSNSLLSTLTGGGNPTAPTATPTLGSIVGSAVNAVGTSAASATNTISDLFLRGVIIILGFIFVAAGLSMFKSPLILSQTGTALKDGATAVANAPNVIFRSPKKKATKEKEEEEKA